MGTRDSGPVINRISNPALHLLVDPFNKFKRADFLDIGIEHRSNGQATEIDELEGGQLKTVLYYGTKNENHFYDTLSRGSNFFSFTVGTNPRYISGATKPFSWKVTGRAYFTKNAEVNWGPLAGTGVDIDDYDLAKVTLRKTFFVNKPEPIKEITLLSEYTIGKELFETDSLDLFLITPIRFGGGDIELPFMLKLHIGPMDRLANYTEPMTSLGIGFAFSY